MEIRLNPFPWMLKKIRVKKTKEPEDFPETDVCADAVSGITCDRVEPEEQVCRFCEEVIDEDGDCECVSEHMIAVEDGGTGRFVALIQGITMRDRQEFIDLFDMHGICYELSTWDEFEDLDDFVRSLNSEDDDDDEEEEGLSLEEMGDITDEHTEPTTIGDLIQRQREEPE